MSRDMRLATRPHGGGPTHFNVTPASSCSSIADVLAGNAEKGLLS